MLEVDPRHSHTFVIHVLFFAKNEECSDPGFIHLRSNDHVLSRKSRRVVSARCAFRLKHAGHFGFKAKGGGAYLGF